MIRNPEFWFQVPIDCNGTQVPGRDTYASQNIQSIVLLGRRSLSAYSERSAHIMDLPPSPSVCLCFCVSDRKVYCGKMAERIRMPFGAVSGVSRGMGVLDGVVIVKGEGAVLRVNLGHPIVTNGAFVTRSSQITLRTCLNYCIDSNQIVHSNKDLQVLFVDGLKMRPINPRWRTACGHHYEKKDKLLYLSNHLTDFDEILHTDTRAIWPLVHMICRNI